MSSESGCLNILLIAVVFWGGLAWLIFHPPSLEDIPWFVAGISIYIILKAYGREKR